MITPPRNPGGIDTWERILGVLVAIRDTPARTTHKLKTERKFFQEIKAGRKPFEIRFNDRDFQVGDNLYLIEIADGVPTGDTLLVRVTYMTDFQQQPGYVVMGII